MTHSQARGSQPGPATSEEAAQKEWWRSLGEAERRFWRVAARTEDPALAWAYFRARQESFASGQS